MTLTSIENLSIRDNKENETSTAATVKSKVDITRGQKKSVDEEKKDEQIEPLLKVIRGSIFIS